mmetsp:Transcript_49275/g.154591  ORF Transcript_49275/g.154591 Transcript_49275/m.154591 type:complete len:430 (+) Transcript_49275:382-1671(+)
MAPPGGMPEYLRTRLLMSHGRGEGAWSHSQSTERETILCCMRRAFLHGAKARGWGWSSRHLSHPTWRSTVTRCCEENWSTSRVVESSTSSRFPAHRTRSVGRYHHSQNLQYKYKHPVMQPSSAVFIAAVADDLEQVVRLRCNRSYQIKIFLVQFEAKYPQVVVDMLLKPQASSDDRSSRGGLVDDPSLSHVSNRDAMLVSNDLHLGKKFLKQIPAAPSADHVVILLLRDRVEIFVLQFLVADIFICQETSANRAVCEQLDIILRAERSHELLWSLIDDAVLHLIRDDLDPPIHNRLQVLRVEIREGEVIDLPFIHHVLHVLEGFHVLVLAPVIPPMKLKEIKLFRAHSLQPLVDSLLNHTSFHVAGHRDPLGIELRLRPELRVLFPEEGRHELCISIMVGKIEGGEASFNMFLHGFHRLHLVRSVPMRT